MGNPCVRLELNTWVFLEREYQQAVHEAIQLGSVCAVRLFYPLMPADARKDLSVYWAEQAANMVEKGKPYARRSDMAIALAELGVDPWELAIANTRQCQRVRYASLAQYGKGSDDAVRVLGRIYPAILSRMSPATGIPTKSWIDRSCPSARASETIIDRSVEVQPIGIAQVHAGMIAYYTPICRQEEAAGEDTFRHCMHVNTEPLSDRESAEERQKFCSRVDYNQRPRFWETFADCIKPTVPSRHR